MALVPRALTAIEGMDHMQAGRTDPVQASSLYQALLDERRVLTNQALVYLPTLEFDTLQMEFFSDKAGDRKRACDSVGRQLIFSGAVNEECVGIHHACFTSARNAYFFIIPVRMEEHWITIFGVIQDKDTSTIQLPNTFWDKKVTHIKILDPFATDRDARAKRAMASLQGLFTEASIEIPDDSYRTAQVTRMAFSDTAQTWQTGLVAYSLCAELLGRAEAYYEVHRNAANLSEAARNAARNQAFNAVWDPIRRQTYKYDFYRDRIRNACGSRAIQQTEYRARMAIEIPGRDAERNHKLMLTVNHRNVEVPPVPPRESILGPSNASEPGYLYIRDNNEPGGVVAKRAHVTRSDEVNFEGFGFDDDGIKEEYDEENDEEEEEEEDEPPAKRNRYGMK